MLSTISAPVSRRFPETIPPHEFQSVTTDQQQTWPTQLPSLRHTTQPLPLNFPVRPQEDFVLYADDLPRSPRALQSERTRKVSSTGPDSTFMLGTSPLQLEHIEDPRRRHSHRQFSAISPLQNPRVRQSIQRTGSINSSSLPQRVNSTGQIFTQYNTFTTATSAATSSRASANQARPPMPPFTSNTSMESFMAPFDGLEMNALEGKIPRGDYVLPSSLTLKADATMFDLLSSTPIDIESSNLDSIFPELSSPHLSTFVPVNSSVLPTTISPKDLMMDQSAPPSSSMTNLSTPSQDFSPYPAYSSSTDTSPLYAHDGLPEEANSWNSLFPGESVDDLTQMDVLRPSIETIGLPLAMERSISSPRSSVRSHAPHVSNSGISRRATKPLKHINFNAMTDPVVLKRARNTAAARKSRLKKQEDRDGLVNKNDQLRIDNEILLAENLHLRALIEKLTTC